jgi:hypothetical protein
MERRKSRASPSIVAVFALPEIFCSISSATISSASPSSSRPEGTTLSAAHQKSQKIAPTSRKPKKQDPSRVFPQTARSLSWQRGECRAGCLNLRQAKVIDSTQFPVEERSFGALSFAKKTVIPSDFSTMKRRCLDWDHSYSAALEISALGTRL